MMKMLQYVITPISILVTMNMAAGLQFFFLVSGCLQYIHSVLFLQPWMRRLLGLPPEPPGGFRGRGGEPVAGPAPGGGGAPAAWQPPRSGATGAPIDTRNPVTNIKNMYSNLKQQMAEYGSKAAVKNSRQKAEDYEKRRSLEEQKKYYERLEENRLKNTEKKNL